MITAGLILLPFTENDKHSAGITAPPAYTQPEKQALVLYAQCRWILRRAPLISLDNYCQVRVVYYSPMLIVRQALNAE